MKKFFRHFPKFFSVCFLLVAALTMSACAGFDPDGPNTDDSGISVEGVKVLRRPLGYDYGGGAVAENNFYESMALDILSTLMQTYGYFNTIDEQQNNFAYLANYSDNVIFEELATDFENNPDNYVYFYDALRYQTVSVRTDETTGITTVVADKSKGWNWTINSTNNNYKILIDYYNYVSEPIRNNNLITSDFLPNDFTYEKVAGYFSGNGDLSIDFPFSTDQYQAAFVNYNEEGTTTDYEKALTYAIYSITLGLQPNEMQVSFDLTTGMPIVTVSGFSPKDGKSSVDLALEDRKNLFNELGSYVGLTQRNKEAIAEFVLNEIIGEQAVSFSKSSQAFAKLYYEEIVSAVINYSGTLTTIGKTIDPEEGGDTTVGENFIASELVDYPGTSFFSMPEGDPFQFTGQHEYQSVLIMPLEEIEITDIFLDFKYDAGDDGDMTFDRTKFLDVEVSIRWNKNDGTPVKVITKPIRMIDGPFEPYEDECFLEFNLSDEKEGFGEIVKLGKFETPKPLVITAENRKLMITGFTDARRYYEVLESSTYGGYGVLNAEKVNQPYLEIAFNIAKVPGDTKTNYKFFTSIHHIHEDVKIGDHFI